VAKVFKISRNTLSDCEKRAAAGEGLAPRKRKRPHKKIPPQQLRDLMAKTPGIYSGEIAAEFGCSQSSAWNALWRLGFTSKKKLPPSKSATKPCAKPFAKPLPASSRKRSRLWTKQA
jgi:hypothetical protein